MPDPTGALSCDREQIRSPARCRWWRSGPCRGAPCGRPSGRLGTRTREQGRRKALEADGARVSQVRSGDWSARSGCEAGLRIAEDRDVTAVFCANDHMAPGLLRVLHEAGRSIPRDIGVAGFDDIPEAAYFAPPLTTVRQNFGELGRRAPELLVEEPAGVGHARSRGLVPLETVLRRSTGPSVRR
ncbi:substrate-binding domain-containing protein [Kitasatospora paracochleata]|uniref:substrate-binding domain-containing protein n=1 Tax=Kitasatospora paracochleata TaxID=58354 RepID=UPI0020A3540A